MRYTKKHEALYDEKNTIILSSEKVKTKEIGLEEYYHLLFERNGELQLQERSEEHYYDRAYNSIVLRLNVRQQGKEDEKVRKGTPLIILKDLDELCYVRGREFAITAPVTYVGKKRDAKSARLLYGFAIDLDGVGISQLNDVLHQMYHNAIPTANIIVNSGHGLHLYYLIDEPIPLFESNQKLLNEFKRGMTNLIWNSYTSFDPNKQFQNVLQGFRVPESLTKFGKVVRAFKVVDRPLWSFCELNTWFCDYHDDYGLRGDKLKAVLGVKFESKDKKKLTLSKAKELYPDWYERVVVRGEVKGRWYIKSDLYEWWLKKLQNEGQVKEGHRYNCIMALVIFAKKCDMPFKRVRKDAYSLLKPFEQITSKDDNHFTKSDIDDALKMYKEDIVTFPRSSLEYITGIRIDANKRNGRNRKEHLKGARALQEIYNPDWREGNGRPKGSTISAENSPQAKKVAEWRFCNPNGNKSECARDLGISRPTVRKWWGY